MLPASPAPLPAGLLAALVEEVAELSSMQALEPAPSNSETDWDFAQLDIGALEPTAQGSMCAHCCPASADTLLTRMPHCAAIHCPGDFLLETTNLRAAARAEVESALKRFLSPQRVLLRDKLTWCCGTLSMVGAAYWLGHSPQ